MDTIIYIEYRTYCTPNARSIAMAQEAEDTVIDDEMIVHAITDAGVSRGGSLTPGMLAETMAEAMSLCLSFKHILKIANLHGFSVLQKLCLDNNSIEKIENVDHLVHLTWLDLSFNCIRRISGLSKLKRLADLSLFSNYIEQIEGLDDCLELQCLSFGNNKIVALDSIVALRGFVNLRLLNLEGNPVCKEGEYRRHVLAYLNQLTYLDYSMVTKAESTAARELYQDELLDVEEKEALREERMVREAANAMYTSKLRMANLAAAETIFGEMFVEDTEMTKLQHLPGTSNIKTSFQTEVDAASDVFIQAGLAQEEHKRIEIALLEETLKKLRAQYAHDSISLIESFERTKKKRLNQITSHQSQELTDVNHLRQLLADLSHNLLDLEMQQVGQFEEAMGDFERKFVELKTCCLESQQSFFRAVEECEKNYTRNLTQLMNELLEKAAKDDLPIDISDEGTSLLADRDTCLNAVAGSHDIHVGRLYKLEDDIKNREEQASKVIIKKYRDQEHERSRARVQDLKEYESTLARELMELPC